MPWLSRGIYTPPLQKMSKCPPLLQSDLFFDYQSQLFKIFNLENLTVEESWSPSDTIQFSHMALDENQLPTPVLSLLRIRVGVSYCQQVSQGFGH